MEKTTKKPELNLVGPRTGTVTLDDIVKMFKQLTGEDPTPEDLQEAEDILNKPPDLVV